MNSDPTRGGRRALRVLILGLSSLLLGVGAHLVGGGSLPGFGVLAGIMVPLGLVATALTRSRCRLPVLSAVLIMEQLGLHAILSAADHAMPVTGGTHAAHLITVLGPVPEPTMITGPAMITSPAMWLAHLAATVATAALLARGEALWWRLVETVADLIRPRDLRSRTRRNTRPGPVLPDWSPAPLHLLAPRRGPPAAFAV